MDNGLLLKISSFPSFKSGEGETDASFCECERVKRGEARLNPFRARVRRDDKMGEKGRCAWCSISLLESSGGLLNSIDLTQ
jgi:hypothetical protein